MRDLILGVRVLDGVGQDLTFGGRVMKNVAGFDVSRLMTGALGTLGVVTEVSLKCLPLPKAETTLALECSADEAIRMANEWGGQPLPLSATCFHDGRLRVRLSGASPAVVGRGGEDRRQRGGATPTRSGPACATTRTRSSRRRAGVARPLWRLSVKSTAPYTDLGGEQLIEWGGALALARRGRPHRRAEGAGRGRPRTAATRRCSARRTRSAGVFHPLADTLVALHRRLKSVFDPHGILNPRPPDRCDVLMQTDLAAEFRDTHEGREADAILRSCVHCGFCTATCPTYQIAGRRARRAARAHLPHQAGARGRRRSPRRRNCTSTAA